MYNYGKRQEEAEEQLRRKIMQAMGELGEKSKKEYTQYVYINDAPSDSDEVREAFITLLNEMLRGKDLKKVVYIKLAIRSAEDIREVVEALNVMLSRKPTAEDFPAGKMSVACDVCFEETSER